MEKSEKFSPVLNSISLNTLSEYFEIPIQPKSKDILIFIFSISFQDFTWSLLKPYEELISFYKKNKKFLKTKQTLLKDKAFKNLNDKEKLAFIESLYKDLFSSTEVLDSHSLQEFLEVSHMSFRGVSQKLKEGYVKKKTGGRVKNDLKLCNCSKYVKRFQVRWMLVRDSGLCLSKNKDGEQMSDYLMFDDKFEMIPYSDSGYKDGILISNSKRKLLVRCGSLLRALEWVKAIKIASDNCEYKGLKTYNSLYPQRRSNKVRIYIDGEDYFHKVYQKLKSAKEQVFISDWWLSPDLYLKRPATKNPKSQLIKVLERIAKNGVSVFVHVYKELASALTLNSKYTVERLKAAHPLIRAFRHPKRSIYGGDFLWSHHEKVICIDQEIAFLGGLDLCYGRMDTRKHKLKDTGKHKYFNGIDYSNSRLRDIKNVNLWEEDQLNRETEPRMPWHDVSLMIRGDAAYDVSINFIELWNHVMTDFYGWYNNQPKELLTPFSTTKHDTETMAAFEIDSAFGNIEREEVTRKRNETINKRKNEQLDLSKGIKTQEYRIRGSFIKTGSEGTCDCQIVRSAGLWSYGLASTDTSIALAYQSLIREANYFIYIENQFFISSTAGEPVKNTVAQELVNKILEKNAAGEKFKVIVVVPLLPGFAGEVDNTALLRIQLHFEYQTISRGPNSIYKQLEDKGIDPKEYIRFYGLRTHEVFGDIPKTEIVYVHSKLMVVDDDKMIIGSANINDRSMTGDHDSEIAVVIQDREKFKILIDGKRVQVSRTVHEFRIKIFKEFSGENDSQKLSDPFSNDFVKEWEGTAENNTLKYRSVFGCYPDDSILKNHDIRALKESANLKSYEREKDQIKGFLVEFPLDFLKEEDLTFKLTDIERLAPMKSFI